MEVNLVDTILSTVLVSIPEQIFVSFFTLFILKSIDILRTNIFKKSMMILATALFTNVPYLLHIDQVFGLLLNTIFIITVVTVALRKNIFMTILAVVVSVILLVVSEAIFGLPIMAAFGITSDNFNNNAPLAALFSIPCRLAQFSFVYWVWRKKFGKEFSSWSLIMAIRASKKYRLMSIVFSVVLLIAYTAYVKYCAFDGILDGVDPIGVLLISALIIVLPVLPFPIIGYCFKKNTDLTNELQASISVEAKMDFENLLESANKTGDVELIAKINACVEKWGNNDSL